jgi:hypothetical protein
MIKDSCFALDLMERRYTKLDDTVGLGAEISSLLRSIGTNLFNFSSRIAEIF